MPGETLHAWVDRFEQVFVIAPLPILPDHEFLSFLFSRALPGWVAFMVVYPNPPNILTLIDNVRNIVPAPAPVLALAAPPVLEEEEEPEPMAEVIDPEMS